MELVIKVDDRKLRQALARAPKEISKHIRQTMEVSMKEVAVQARSAHRFTSRKGNLERSVKWDVKPDGSAGRTYLSKSIAPYGAAIHQGSKRHRIAARDAGALHFVSQGRSFLVPKRPTGSPTYFSQKAQAFIVGKGFVSHPGTRKDQFLFKAFRLKKKKILEGIKTAVSQSLKIAGFK